MQRVFITCVPPATILSTLAVLTLAAGCGSASSPVMPSNPAATPAAATPVGVVRYTATFTASASCASELPPSARQRTYTMTIDSSGGIQWSGPTVKPPLGHLAVSSGAFSGDAFSFSVDFDRDPQSDDFHGIWDDMGDGTFLNISGKGTGAVHGDEIRGTLNGLIAFYQPVVPAQPGVLIEGRYCPAADHTFSFVRQ